MARIRTIKPSFFQSGAGEAAGIRPHRVPVRLDRVESIAATLRKYLTPEQLSTLARLLMEGQ